MHVFLYLSLSACAYVQYSSRVSGHVAKLIFEITQRCQTRDLVLLPWMVIVTDANKWARCMSFSPCCTPTIQHIALSQLHLDFED